jgi:Tol biopolymer transport system component
MLTFVLQQSTEIYLARADGTQLRRVTQAQKFAGSPTWSADGKHLLFYEAQLGELAKVNSVTRQRGTMQIATIDLATNDHSVLTTGPGEKWSPRFVAADRIAYASGGPEGGLEFVTGIAGARGEVSAPSWSPDRRRMLFHRDVEPHAWPPFQPWHSKDPQFRLVRTGIFPSYAPSGDRLLSNDAPGARLTKNILAMNADGSQQSVFVEGGEKSPLGPVWSPAGDHVAFALGRFFQTPLAPTMADIAVVNRDGSGLTILTDGSANFGFPSWSPDGGQIVYRASGKDNQASLS